MYDAVRDVITVADSYFRLMNTFDADRFYEVFHENARLYGYRDNSPITWTAAEYRELIGGREAPSKRGEQPNGEILNIALTSEHQAVVVVRVSIAGTRFRDVLTLFRDTGAWRIVSKTFTVEAACEIGA